VPLTWVFVRHQGTPNLLKLAARLLGVLAIALIWPLTWAFTGLSTFGASLAFRAVSR
jgi:hypothetical protein